MFSLSSFLFPLSDATGIGHKEPDDAGPRSVDGTLRLKNISVASAFPQREMERERGRGNLVWYASEPQILRGQGLTMTEIKTDCFLNFPPNKPEKIRGGKNATERCHSRQINVRTWHMTQADITFHLNH